MQVQRKLFIWYIDYTKAFGKVQHGYLLEMLKQLGKDGKDIRVIRNLYWEQTAVIAVETQFSQVIKIQQGIMQGYALSPDLFNLYTEMILSEIKAFPCIIVGGQNINNLRYADNTAIISSSEAGLKIYLISW